MNFFDNEQDERILMESNKIYARLLDIVIISVLTHYLYQSIILSRHNYLVLFIGILKFYGDISLAKVGAYRFSKTNLFMSQFMCLGFIIIAGEFVADFLDIRIGFNFLFVVVFSIIATIIYKYLLKYLNKRWAKINYLSVED